MIERQAARQQVHREAVAGIDDEAQEWVVALVQNVTPIVRATALAERASRYFPSGRLDEGGTSTKKVKFPNEPNPALLTRSLARPRLPKTDVARGLAERSAATWHQRGPDPLEHLRPHLLLSPNPQSVAR